MASIYYGQDAGLPSYRIKPLSKQNQEQQALQQSLGPAPQSQAYGETKQAQQQTGEVEPASPGSPTTATGQVSQHPWDPQIYQWYEQYLKRTPTPQEIRPHYGERRGLDYVGQTIVNSPEYLALQQSLQNGEPPVDEPQDPAGYGDLEGDYGGFSAPQWMPAEWGDPMAGWDAGKFGNVDHLTPKYVVGRILSNYDVTDPTQISAAIADIQRAYPGATWDGKDALTIPGVGTIDIIQAASTDNPAWQWLVPGSTGGGGGTTGGATISSQLPPNFDWVGMSPNDLLRMAMSRLAMNRVLWDNPMMTPWS